jgi:peptide/nickel transport system permease protein
MWRYVFRRLLLVPIILAGMTLITFSVTRFVPTDPVVAFLGNRGADNLVAYQNYYQKYGLDKSIPEQYLLYVGNLLQGDLGQSTSSRRPVIDELAQFFPATIELAIIALLIAIIVGVPLGIFAAARRGRPEESVVKGFSLLGISSPGFVVALIAMQVFYLQLGVAAGPGRIGLFVDRPPTITGMVTLDSLLTLNWDALGSSLHHIALPAMVLGLLNAAYFSRIVRSTMLDALDADFLRTARGKGLASRIVLFRHAFRYAVIPTISLVGLAFGDLFAGAITVETITGWPGVGKYMYNAAVKLDFPAVMGGTLLIGFAYIVINLIVDLLYARADPRIRLG